MANFDEYNNQVADIARRASQMRNTLVEPFRAEDGGFLTPRNTQEAQARNGILESAIKGTVYEGFQNGASIAGVHARALQGYERKYGHLPSADLLASCHKSVENALLLTTGKGNAGGIFESAADDFAGKDGMSKSEGIALRDRLVSLVLPIWLQTISANMVTFIPGDFNQSIFYRIKRVAGSTFGNYVKGQLLDWDFDGQYSVMDQLVKLTDADGSTTKWTFDSKTKYGVVYPFKAKRTRIYVDHSIVAEDNGSGSIVGTFIQGSTSVVVSGTVNYATGNVEATFSVAPTSGLEIHLGYDVDIEQDPTLIPRVDHVMATHTLYPHESAITGNATTQALWALRRELGQDIDNLTMQTLRNVLAADKDRKHLNAMLFAAKDNVEWDKKVPTALTKDEHYATVKAALMDVDAKLAKGNGVSGLVGIVAGTEAANVFRYLHTDFIQVAPDYHFTAQPHYVGRLWHQWDLYCNPNMDANTCLCFAKGPDHGQTAFVAGDAVPALTFRHPVMGDLNQRATMWDLAYRDMQPFDGEKYLCKLTMVESKA